MSEQTRTGSGTSVRRSSGSAGFSLAEVLVALAVAAMLAAILTRFVAGTRANAAKVAELTAMTALGETLLARLPSPQGLKPGRTEGRHNVFAWRIEISPASFEARAGRLYEDTLGSAGETEGQTSTAAASKPAPRSSVSWVPYYVAVRIEAPSGQSHAVDTIRIGPGGR
jgi:prepilin-type N-terminal cleavage/methylation domain-containing protein